MGQNNFKPDDYGNALPLNWQQSPTDANLLINRLTQQHLQRHHATISIQDLPRQTTLLAARINNPHPYVCRLYYYHLAGTQHRDTGDPSKDTRDIYTYTDRMLPLRKDEWNRQKIINTIQALKRLVIVYAPFCLTEQMIGQSELGHIRIWINNNPAISHPNYSCESEEQTLGTLIALLTPKNQDLANTLRGCRFLRQALEKLEAQAKPISTPYQRLSHRPEETNYQHIDSNKPNPVNYNNEQVDRGNALTIQPHQFSHFINNRTLLKSQSNLSNLYQFKNKSHNFPGSKTPHAEKVSYRLPYQIAADHPSSFKFPQSKATMGIKRHNTTFISEQQKMRHGFKMNPLLHPISNDSGQISSHCAQQSLPPNSSNSSNNLTFPSSKIRSYVAPFTNTPCRFSYKQSNPLQTPAVSLSSGYSHHNYLASKGLVSPNQNNSYFEKTTPLQHCPTAPNKCKFLNQTDGNLRLKNQPNKVPDFIKNMKKKATAKDNQQPPTLQNMDGAGKASKDTSFAHLTLKPNMENRQADMNKSTKQSFVSGHYHSRPDSHRKPQKLYTFCSIPADSPNLPPTNNRTHQLNSPLFKPITISKSPFKQKSNTSSRPNLNVPKNILGHAPSVSCFQGINKSQVKKQKQKTLNRTKTSEWSNKTKITNHFETITFHPQLQNLHAKAHPKQSIKPPPTEQPPTIVITQIQQQKKNLKKQLKLQFESLLGEQDKELMSHLSSKPNSSKQKPIDQKTEKKELNDKIKMKQLAFAELKKQALMVLTDD